MRSYKGGKQAGVAPLRVKFIIRIYIAKLSAGVGAWWVMSVSDPQDQSRLDFGPCHGVGEEMYVLSCRGVAGGTF